MVFFKKKKREIFTRKTHSSVDVTHKWFRIAVGLMVLFVIWRSYETRHLIEKYAPEELDRTPLIVLQDDSPETESDARLEKQSNCVELPKNMQRTTRYDVRVGSGAVLPCSGSINLAYKIQSNNGETIQSKSKPHAFTLEDSTPFMFAYVLDGMQHGGARFGVASAEHFAAFGLKEAPPRTERLYLFIDVAE